MASKLIRLDELLVIKELAPTIEEARTLIMSGVVSSESQILDKVGVKLRGDTKLHVKRKKNHPWVSRGGIKLAHALEIFGVDVSGFVAADIGASTGGFTDVLLTKGATKIYAVDVGYNELDFQLRQDDRVVVLERLNARYLNETHIPESLDLIVCDVSFISIKQALPAIMSMVPPYSILITLIKPQFEVTKNEVGTKGVVTDPILHKRVCNDIKTWVIEKGWNVKGVIESPITGREGNKEFLLMGVKQVDE